jgi:tricorn protease
MHAERPRTSSRFTRFLALFLLLPVLVLGEGPPVVSAAAPANPDGSVVATAWRAAPAGGVLAPAALAEDVKFARWPHVSHGRLVFSYHGDLWIGNADGSDIRRLTSHVANDVRPRFSPDGTQVAFTSNRAGTNHVYIVPIEGGEPRQVTFHPSGDNVQYWAPDGSAVLITSSRGPEAFRNPLFLAPIDGSIPTPMGMDAASSGMIRQDGGMVAFNRKGFSFTRRGYLGNNAADLWVQDLGSGEFRQLTNEDVRAYRDQGHTALPMWGADGQVYFISEESGMFNIWRIPADGGSPEQVTFHTADGVQYPSISPDGRTISYTKAFDIWTLDLPDGTPRRVTLDMRVDPREHLIEMHTFSNRAEGFSPSPDGEYIAVDVRGRIFIVPAENGVGEPIQVTDTHWRDRFHSWSPNGRYLAYVSDESGEEEVWIYEIATGDRRMMTNHPSQKTGVEWAHDSGRFAFEASNTLFIVDVASGRQTELAYNRAGGYSLQGFSPDGDWLVFMKRDDDMNAEVYLYEISTGREVDITRNPYNNGGGVLTPDQKQVVFTSNRTGTNHLYVVSLQRLTENPDDPIVRERAARGATLRERMAGASGGADTASGGAAARRAAADPDPITFDLEGIERRARALTTGSNGVGSYFLSTDGATVYFTSSDGDGAGLFAVGIDGRNRRRIAAGSFPGLTPSHDRRFVFFRGATAGGPGSEVHRMQLSNQRRARIDFSLPIWVDLREEWKQIFEESWRVMTYRFYDENMHGMDWVAIRTKYRELLPYVSTYNDLYDVANKMLGELNASHLGVSGPGSRPQSNDYRSRYLGFEMEPGNGGRYRVSHVYREGPADHEWIDLSVGDYVLALNGEELRAGDNYWRTLTRLTNDWVTVRVADAPGGAGARDIRMETVGSLNNIRYEEWVERNREFVEQESDGRVAYVHIRSMNQPSLERFETEINRYWNAESIVVDVRFNGGGNIDQQLIDILERQPYQFWNSRWGAPTWGRRPRQAIAGPKVMLINHRSGSDAEVTPLGFQQLGLGTLVGNPTAGAVIATGSYGLIHGGSIRTPGSLVVTWDPTQPDNHGINLENLGVAPDVWVENSPEDELRGFDRELKAAVDEALRRLVAEEASR